MTVEDVVGGRHVELDHDRLLSAPGSVAARLSPTTPNTIHFEGDAPMDLASDRSSFITGTVIAVDGAAV